MAMTKFELSKDELAELEHLYIVDNFSARECIEKMGLLCSENTVVKILRENDVTIRPYYKKYLFTKKDAEELHITKGLPLDECSELLSCSTSTFRLKLKEFGIPLQPKKRKKVGQYNECESCGKSFYVCVSRSSAKHCSKECSKKREIVTCAYCGIEFEGKKSKSRKYCSKDCYGKDKKGCEAHPNLLKAIEENSVKKIIASNKKGLDSDTLIKNIIVKRISPPAYSKMIDVSQCTILRRMREHGITLDSYHEL